MSTSRTLALALGLLMVLAVNVNAQEPATEDIPLSNSPSVSYAPQPLTYAQQNARFAADQRMFRIQWNKWIGHDPLRPTMNASYMANGLQRFYIPSRSVIVSSSHTRAWYW